MPITSLSLSSRPQQPAIAQEVLSGKEASLQDQKGLSTGTHDSGYLPDSPIDERRNKQATPRHFMTETIQVQGELEDGSETTDMNKGVVSNPLEGAMTTAAISVVSSSASSMASSIKDASYEARSHYYEEYQSHLNQYRHRRSSHRIIGESRSVVERGGQGTSVIQPTVGLPEAERASFDQQYLERSEGADDGAQAPPSFMAPIPSIRQDQQAWSHSPFLRTHSRSQSLSSPNVSISSTQSTLTSSESFNSCRQNSPSNALLSDTGHPLAVQDRFRSQMYWPYTLPHEVTPRQAQAQTKAQSRQNQNDRHVSARAPNVCRQSDTADGSGVFSGGCGGGTLPSKDVSERSQSSLDMGSFFQQQNKAKDDQAAIGVDGLLSLRPRPQLIDGERVPISTKPSTSTFAQIQLRPKSTMGTVGSNALDNKTTRSAEDTSTVGSGSGAVRNPLIFKVQLPTRGTSKGPLPIEFQIKLLSSVLHHDPFNCPIRRTTQVWEAIAQELGIRARTCARRFDNIIQASIAGRERLSGTEEQIAIKKQLLEQLLEMMNQPQAKVRMQNKRRYRSEEADRQLLLETIRFNPFGQKIGLVAKAWEDVRDALNMKVHARQCIRRVNRIIKPYLLRERMYKGNIPEEMQEENDELVKQVLQLMHLSGHSGSLEDDDGNSNEEESASESDDAGDTFLDADDGQQHGRSQHSNEDKIANDQDDRMVFPLRSNFGSQSPQSRIIASPLSEPSFSTPASMIISTSRRNRKRYSNQSSPESMKRNVGEHATAAIDLEEFRPQRIWGSHPYSRTSTSRSVSSSSRCVYASHSRSEQQQPTNTIDPERGIVFPRSPLSEDAHQNRPNLPSPTASSISTITAGNLSQGLYPSREGSMTQGVNESNFQMYRAILSEFHTVRDYLSQMSGQRQRDKENQKMLYHMMERMQQQIQEQQHAIDEMQQQLQLQPRPQSSDASPSDGFFRQPLQHQSSPLASKEVSVESVLQNQDNNINTSSVRGTEE
ncbi:hypothetical protein BGX28_009174 [Mortierella sp. GBA30]|nr:hypothetical protein BGX28_009174 [Mortierella sp. GBA30]